MKVSRRMTFQTTADNFALYAGVLLTSFLYITFVRYLLAARVNRLSSQFLSHAYLTKIANLATDSLAKLSLNYILYLARFLVAKYLSPLARYFFPNRSN